MATSDAQTTARELYATLVNTAIATSLTQLRAALSKLEKSDSDDPKAVKAALPRNTSSDIRNFLVALAEQGTLNQLTDIIDILEQYNQETPAPPGAVAPEPAPSANSSASQRSAGPLQAEVVNPGPLSEARKSRILHDLHQLYGPQLDITFVEDASLKGGMIIRVRDLEAPNKLGGEFSEIIQMLESGEEHLEAEVVSAVPLSQEQQDRISRELQQRYDARLDLHFRADESLIGGLIIRVGDQVLDNSLRARMGAVQRSMMMT